MEPLTYTEMKNELLAGTSYSCIRLVKSTESMPKYNAIYYLRWKKAGFLHEKVNKEPWYFPLEKRGLGVKYGKVKQRKLEEMKEGEFLFKPSGFGQIAVCYD